MGVVQRWGLDRLRHAFGYSRQKTTICVTPGRIGLARRRRQAFGARSARDGGVRSHRRVGRQSGVHAGQCDDPHRQGPQAARRQARGGRRLSHAHRRGGRHRPGAAARHRRRAGARHDARAPEGGLRRPRVPGALHRLRPRHRGASRRQDAGMGVGHHRPGGGRDHGLRAALWRHPAQLPAGGLRLHALAQRLGRHACRDLPARHHRRLAASRRRRLLPQSRQLEARHHAGARPRPDRSQDPHHRPVAHRPDPVRRHGGAGRRSAGHGDADAERQLGQCRARQRRRGARARPRGPVHLRARAVHDGDGQVRRHPAARGDVPGIRRHLLRPRPHPSHGRSGRARPLRGLPHQPRGGLRAGAAAGLEPRRASA